MPQYSGVSQRGNVAEAFGHALTAAQSAIGEHLVEWKLISLQGTVGRYQNKNEVSVILDAKAGAEDKPSEVDFLVSQPFFALNNHEKITHNIGYRYVVNGAISSAQLDYIIDENLDEDFKQGNSYVHFDNCCFRGGAERIAAYWRVILRQNNPRSPESLEAFGNLLHTAQDFYSHSNWVELHKNVSPIPTWDFNVHKLPSRIVSGFVWYGLPWNCPRGAPSHGDLNKDTRDSRQGSKQVVGGPNDRKTLFELAFETAEEATLQLFIRYFGFRCAEPEGDIPMPTPRDHRAFAALIHERTLRQAKDMPVSNLNFLAPQCECNNSDASGSIDEK